MRTALCTLGVPLIAAAIASGCIDTKTEIVFRDVFNPPADTASGFLGYYTVAERQTTCGNCHVGQNADWQSTSHGAAFATLESSGGAQDFCYGCHTVSERGNPASTAGRPAGWNAIQHASYQDVQCESCHGPGISHLKAPDLARPLAHIAVLGNESASCASCHEGSHHPYVEEWGASRHARANEFVIERYAADPVTFGSCLSCHEGRSALRALGVSSNYVERDEAITPTTALGHTCAVCHDPHSTENDGQLRRPVEERDPSINLCMTCHNRRSEPSLTSAAGPHAPQGAMILGTAGYRPAGFGYDTVLIISSHGSAANVRLCAGCHVNRTTVTDEVSGDFVFESVGHLFRPIPCLENGIPVPGNDCDNYEPANAGTVRSYASCAQANCHADQTNAAQRLGVTRVRIEALAVVLWEDLNGDQQLDPDPVDRGYLPTVLAMQPGEFDPTDNRISPAEGGLFNTQLTAEDRASNGDRSRGVHNPFLAEALLRANILEMQATYPFLPAPPPALFSGGSR
jgi:predicted CXXCH cytochrome family protein